MAETSGFFLANLVDGEYDRKYYAKDFASYFAMFIGNGIFADSKMLAVSQSATAGMSVLVSSGDAFINGYWYKNSELMSLTIEVANATLPRYDMIALRLDLSTRSMNLVVKKGTPSSTPVEPLLTKTDDLYELGLAKIYVAAGATKIVNSDITDLRLDNNYCGTVSGVVKQIDTTEYGKQLNDFIANYISTTNQTYEEFKASLQTLIDKFSAEAEQQLQNEESEFTTWFEGIKGRLGNDPATSLQTQIDAMRYPVLPTDTILEWALTARSGDTACVLIGTATDGINEEHNQFVKVCTTQTSRIVLLKDEVLSGSYSHQRNIVGNNWSGNWSRRTAWLTDLQLTNNRVTTIENTLNTLGVVAKGTIQTEGIHAVPYILFAKTLSPGVYTFSYYGRVNTGGDEPALIGTILLSKPIAGQIGGHGEILSQAGLQRDSVDCINITFTICLEEETDVSCKVVLSHRPPLYESIWSLVKVC